MKINIRNPLDVITTKNLLPSLKSSAPRAFKRQCHLCGEIFRTDQPTCRSCAPCRTESELYQFVASFPSEE